jgi:hypothetical protein
VAAPPYIGAVVLFLFLLGLLLVKGRARWWLLVASGIALVLSWGKNFSLLTDLMIDYFPLYNKFRAVSSVQVILELCVPILAVLALRAWISTETSIEKKRKALIIALSGMIGLGVVLLLLKSAFDFTGANDGVLERYYGEELVDLIRRDRESVYMQDTFRSMIFILLAGLLLWLNFKKTLAGKWMILSLGVLIVVDLVSVDLRYVNKEDFVTRRQLGNSFPMTQADKQILQDTAYYRVLNPSEGLNGARTSYYHKSLGGYHAAKPQRLLDLFEFHIYQNNRRVLDMLNTKYLIQADEEGNPRAALNPGALGNAWFVSQLTAVESPDEAIQTLSSLDPAREAIINTNEFPKVVPGTFEVDSTSQIRLVSYSANALEYISESPEAGMGVFSEMYYPEGWKAYIDGKPEPHFRVNYALRGMVIPGGRHEITFRFEPEVIRIGSQISLAGTTVLALLLLGGVGMGIFRKRGSH